MTRLGYTPVDPKDSERSLRNVGDALELIRQELGRGYVVMSVLRADPTELPIGSLFWDGTDLYLVTSTGNKKLVFEE